MTTLSEFPTSDLILRVSGGSRDGELIPVATPKCYLGMGAISESVSKNPHCVIFRGRRGAVIRSYADRVTFNDTEASLHWLQKGDTIKFPNAMKVEVVQLGELKDSVAPNSSPASQIVKQTTRPQATEDSRLIVLESELRSIQLQNEETVTRFDQLDSRLTLLTEKMTMLINLSSNGTRVEVSQVSTPVETGLVAPTADNSQTQTQQNQVLAIERQTPVVAVTSVEETATNAPVENDGQIDEFKAVEKVNQIVNQTIEAATAAGVQTEEVIQSPVLPSPQEELNRIDKAIEGSIAGYSSQDDDSDEQILTFNSNPTGSGESIAVSSAAVAAEDQMVTTPTDATPSLTAGGSTTPATVLPPKERPEDAEAAAAAKAKATTDEAEKESRLSEMARIFGGAESNDDKTAEQSDEGKLVQVESGEAGGSVATNQPADNQSSQTLKDLNHGQNAEVESDAQPQAQSIQANNLESQLSPLALQLLKDVKENQNQEKAEVEARVETQDSTSTSELIETESPVEVLAESMAPVQAEPETATVPEQPANESVADLLARMKEDGKWDGIHSDDDSAEPVQPTPEPEPTPSALGASDESDDDDVENYMSQLLSRMRSDDPAPVVTASEIKERKEAKKKNESMATEKPKLKVPMDPLKAEDFKPKQKAAKLKSLDAMRELANSNARTNVKVSEIQNQKAKAYLSGGVGLGAILMALFYFLFTSQAIVGILCLAMAGVCGFSLFKNLTASKTLAAAKQAKTTA